MFSFAVGLLATRESVLDVRVGLAGGRNAVMLISRSGMENV